LQEDRLQKVARNGHLLLELINDVLDLSKIEAGRLYLTMGAVDITALLDSVLDSFESQTQAKHLRLVRGYGPLPPLYGDEGRIKQILHNLVSNAVKFTNAGMVIVRGHFNPTRQQVILTVTDTGIGIAPADQDRIFDAFHQSNGTLAREHEGTGLGLAIARRLTEMHGGSLWFESARDHGSSFHVALPTVDDRDPPPLILEPRARVDGPIIVAMDSDYESLRDIQRALESDAFRVYGAHTGNDGLRLVYALKPVLVLLDPARLGDDGARVIDVLAHDPATRQIPVLIIASDTGEGVPHGALVRPFERDALVRRVHLRLVTAAEPEEERA
jgi:two-component sensor histidine kinase